MSESMLEPDTTGRCLGREDASFISYNFLVSIFHNRQANCLEHGLPFICYRCPHLLLFLEWLLTSQAWSISNFTSARKPSPTGAFCRKHPWNLEAFIFPGHWMGLTYGLCCWTAHQGKATWGPSEGAGGSREG